MADVGGGAVRVDVRLRRWCGEADGGRHNTGVLVAKNFTLFLFTQYH